MSAEHGTRVSFTTGYLDINKDDKVLRLNPSHWIYALTLSKDFDAYFNCVTPFHTDGRQIVDYSQPHLQKLRISGLEFEFASFPEEEAAILAYFRWYRPQAGETVFDLGANCGLSVYYLSQAVGPTGKVYAFEPDPVNHEVMLRNIERHHLSNVVPLRMAIAAGTAKLEFFCEGTIGSTLARQSSRETTGKVINVDAISLADACRSYGVPTFIKMDIEGGEIEVIAASRDFLRSHAIQFAIDTNHWKNGQLTCHKVESLFAECGYEVLTSADSGFSTTWARKAATKSDS
jgi:FkbM family methyltransferase